MISIVDYGVGNLKSLENALNYLDFDCKRINAPEEVARVEKMILPGVGAFGYAMQNIEALRLKAALIETANRGVPVLGICLGMQIFFTFSSEGGNQAGLNLIQGAVKRIAGPLKVPHIGWNEIQSKSSILFKNLPSTRFGYFVHSYYCLPENESWVTATTEYGETFVSAVERDNVFGVQFHPEKSQELGLKILQNFAEL
ncbi:imidazole glycerol phosphate synthase subunit HisH [candidate division KSB1 bacterium]|nr:imidazole glycerol phosphate synthase subunit HisH [candidate division KSB1 bacterium]NIR71013.1 imidazole glycerol phosphate synthase subunit HisH [candidate division KSB1 bacterium]NIS26098.1 imidazole glycerol phosphate synthase subunit HisH [candidate division KSB1 bacterium]NIT72892.1 imidazole glycerol phosphate synthase subunit HisH [candidate division KSB1 bacterium]NIU26737.1 imidazole glycerol phosphate synthase subunit HisH [candidate division KSB1 bacterium]